MIQITAQIENELAKIADKQLPFVTSRALNTTAIGARDLVRSNLPKRFKLHGTWTIRGVQAKMSSKNNLIAQVLAPGYLSIHETGGMRKPEKSSMLAAMAPNVAKKQIRVRDKTFRKDMGNGHDAVFKRVGRKGRKIKMIAWLSNEHSYDERLHMGDDVNAYVQSKFSNNFADALAKALSD